MTPSGRSPRYPRLSTLAVHTAACRVSALLLCAFVQRGSRVRDVSARILLIYLGRPGGEKHPQPERKHNQSARADYSRPHYW